MTTFLFDQWVIPASIDAEDVTYHALEDDEQKSVVWRLDFPEALDVAETELGGYLDLIQASSKAIDLLPEEIDEIATRYKSRTQGISFENGDFPTTPAEADLLNTLADVDRSGSLVSFTTDEKSFAEWTDAFQEFRVTAGRLLHAVTSMVWVETRMEGRLLGRTRVGWSGDPDTSYTHGISSEEAALHQRSLRIAVLSRNLMLRTITIAFAGAAKLSVLIATPGGALLALPAVWKYINQILEQVEQYHALNQSNASQPA